jgi:alpha-1,3-mannosyltransferase
MSVLLYLPGVLIILVKRRGVAGTIRAVVQMVAVQVLLGRRFLAEYPREYFSGAFDLSRVFLYKWTVNWRFVDEDIFLSPIFARALLVGHLSILVAFGWFKWTKKDGGVPFLLKRALRYPTQPASPLMVSADGEFFLTFLVSVRC